MKLVLPNPENYGMPTALANKYRSWVLAQLGAQAGDSPFALGTALHVCKKPFPQAPNQIEVFPLINLLQGYFIGSNVPAVQPIPFILPNGNGNGLKIWDRNGQLWEIEFDAVSPSPISAELGDDIVWTQVSVPDVTWGAAPATPADDMFAPLIFTGSGGSTDIVTGVVPRALSVVKRKSAGNVYATNFSVEIADLGNSDGVALDSTWYRSGTTLDATSTPGGFRWIFSSLRGINGIMRVTVDTDAPITA